MIDGDGAPESQTFEEALGALYSTAYTLKFMLKSASRTDFRRAHRSRRCGGQTTCVFFTRMPATSGSGP